MYGPALSPGDEAAAATGIDDVLPRDEFARRGRGARPRRRARSSRRSGPRCWAKRPRRIRRRCGARRRRTRGTAASRARSSSSQKLKAAAPAVRRSTTSIRSSTRCARSRARARSRSSAKRRGSPGSAIMEAMRDARPGMKEYELQADAEFVFKKWGAYGPSYFALIATGAEHLLLALPQEHRDAEGRRPGPVRLRARLQVLPVGRDARVPGERPLHAAAARVLLDLPQALSVGDDVDPPARVRGRTS